MDTPQFGWEHIIFPNPNVVHEKAKEKIRKYSTVYNTYSRKEKKEFIAKFICVSHIQCEAN
jgi:hypothetical protein